MNRFSPNLADVETSPSWGSRLARGVLYLAVLLAIVPKGSTGGLPLVGFALAAALAFLLAALRPPDGRARMVFFEGAGLAILLTAYVLFQSLSFDGNPLANPVWENVAVLLGTRSGSISVAPGMTRQALLSLLPPILTYLGALALFSTQATALRLWKFLGLIGIAFACLGIVQLELTPNAFLFVFEKEFYRDSLTGFFVNRNTAGTFLGVASLILAGWLLSELASVPAPDPVRALLQPHAVTAVLRRRILALALGWGVVVIALFMTKSRGALFATVLAYALVGVLMGLGGLRAPRRGPDAAGSLTRVRRKLLTVVLIALALLLVLAGFGGQTLLRVQERGLDPERVCTYRATWNAFLDHWRLGTGLGTFPSIFPSYRDPTCAGIQGLWLRAHNTWLEGLLVLGVVFVPLCGLVYARLAWILWTGYRTRRRLRPMVIAGAGSLLLVTVHGFLDFSLQIPGMAAYVAAAMGCLTTLCLKRA